MRIILLSLSLLISSITFAATDTRSIRTSTDFVTYDDSVNSVIQKLGNPDNSNEFKMRDRNGRLIFATDLHYSIDGLKYTITIIEGKVFRIVWER